MKATITLVYKHLPKESLFKRETFVVDDFALSTDRLFVFRGKAQYALFKDLESFTIEYIHENETP